MTLPAWKIITLPRVPSTLAQWPRTIKRLRPMGTSVQVNSDKKRLRHGQLVWGLEAGDMLLGIAWDWMEMMPGIVVMGDPMSIVTNASFFDEEGSPVDDAVRLLQVNAAVYQLPWQRNVRDAIRRERCLELVA